jgi:hypothetical protein
MDGTEVLAHITAPSGFQDDKRYLAQAAAVAGFEPCSRLKVYGAYECLPELRDRQSVSVIEGNSTFDTSLSSAWRETGALQESPAQKAARELLNETPAHANPAPSISRRSTSDKHIKGCARPITWRLRKHEASNVKPRSKVPAFRGKLATSTILAARSPEVQRPKTAPAESIGSKPAALRKRARSESSSFESPRAVVPDTQEKHDAITSKGQLYTAADSTDPSRRTNDPIARTALLESVVNLQARPAKRQHVGEARGPNHQSETSDLAQRLGIPGIIPPRAEQKGLASCEFTERATTSLDSSSMWPPQPQTNLTYPPPPEQIPFSRAHDTAFHSIPPPWSQTEPYDNWVFSQAPSSAAKEQAFSRHGFGLPLSSISCLPTAIHAPTPPVGHARYTTHITLSLRTLAARLPLATSFRPVLVRRDINVLERGYWRLRIPVSPNSAVWQGDSDMRSGERSCGRDKPWSEQAFLQFWHTFATHVQSGGSGWALSIYREDPNCTQMGLLDRSNETGQRNSTMSVVLKVACWGEILGHIYLILWVLSDKKTEALQMEWRDAAEEVVVKMGGRQREGRLGEYGFKGGRGAEGVWGIVRGDE